MSITTYQIHCRKGANNNGKITYLNIHIETKGLFIKLKIEQEQQAEVIKKKISDLCSVIFTLL